MFGWTRGEILTQDFRYALRTVRKSPGFAATAILTLALGIGASTAVFTVVDSVILKPLTYRDSGNLVVAWERVHALSADPVGPNPRHVDLWKKRSNVFSGLTLLGQGASGLTLGTDHPRLVGVVNSSPNLFDVLQVTPLLGRAFVPEDGVKGHDNVAILTYPLWQSVFHGDPEVIGKTIRLSDTPRQVVGVLPADFHFPNRNALHPFRSKQSSNNIQEPAIFFPAVIDPSQSSWNGDYGNWIVVARLKPGVSITQAEAQLTSIQAQVIQAMPADRRDNRPGALLASIQPLQEAVVGESKTGLWLLMAAVAGLMLIACVNLANAHLGRTLSRHREAAVQSALGAPKWRLLWTSLAENLLLAAVGGIAGIALAAAGLRLFRLYSPVDIPRLSEVHLNGTVLFFSVMLTLASSILFGILPALKLFRTDPQAALQQSSSRALGSRQSQGIRTWLIGLQVFGCTVLLLITGLFSKSLLRLLHQDKGFDSAQVVVAAVDLPRNTYKPDASRIAFDDGVLENLHAIPGIQSAGMVSAMPLEGESWIEPIQRVDRPDLEAPLLNLRWVSPGYFETMREKLVAGRFFEERDRNLSSAVLSESEAKALWPNENPIGSQVTIEGRTFTVIGIVADSRTTSLKSAPAKMAYVHYKDRPPFGTYFVVRGLQPAVDLIASMREAIWKYAPTVTIARVKAMDSQVNDSLATERFQTSVLLSFGVAALLLAMLGIYGVLTYSVATRKQEIGVRMALGATRQKIYSLTLAEAGAPVVAGLAGGFIASILGGRVIQSFLYGVQVVDPPVITAVAILFLAAALLAALIPARRAASVDPMEALRAE
jgi:predicted permease